MKSFHRHVAVFNSATDTFGIAEFWMELGSDGTAVNGDPMQPCFIMLPNEEFKDANEVGSRVRDLNSTSIKSAA
jgi:hypothetical protein